MLKNFKNKDFITTVIFCLIVFGIFIACILSPKEEISLSERREMAQFPEFTWERLFNGKFFEDFEDFASDQLVLREPLRTFKAGIRYNVLQRLENNGIYVKDDSAVKIEDKLNQSMVESNVKVWQNAVSKYFADANIYYSIIPDKNYYMSNGFYPHLDYNAFNGIVSATKPQNAVNIDISSILGIEDFYSTDLHWKQESIIDIAEKLASSMGATIDGLDKYTTEELNNFYGAYYGQSALPLKPDVITLLHSDVIDSAKVYYWGATQKGFERVEGQMYDEQGKTSGDMYNVFLSGMEGLIEIENPKCQNGKTLYLFRDSFGSSIAPLLLSGYERVVVVDTRYVMSNVLGMIEGLDLTATDVLFLYSTTTLNNVVMR